MKMLEKLKYWHPRYWNGEAVLTTLAVIIVAVTAVTLVVGIAIVLFSLYGVWGLLGWIGLLLFLWAWIYLMVKGI